MSHDATNPFAPPPENLLPRRRSAGVRVLFVALAAVLVLLPASVLVAGRLLLEHASSAQTTGTPYPAAVQSPAPLPRALLGAPRPGGVVVTPAQARSILAAAWPLRETALTRNEPTVLRALETGSAQFGDLARAGCGCPIRRQPRIYQDAAVFVPRQQRFPAHFIVEAATTTSSGGAWLEIMVFTRRSGTTPWQIALDTGYAPDPGQRVALDRPDVDSAGFTRPVSAASTATARRAVAALASYWRAAKDDGAVPALPALLTPGAWTTVMAGRIAAHRQGEVQSNGLTGHFTYEASNADPLFAYATRGGVMACTTIRITSTYTAGPTGVPFQPGTRGNWGPDLAPGRYSSVTTASRSQTCVRPASAQRGAWDAVGGDHLREGHTTGVLQN